MGLGLLGKWARIALSAALLAGSAAAVRAQDPSTLVIAAPADVLSWDPIAHLHSAAMPIYRSVFDSPLTQAPDLTLKPSVIKSWKWIEEGKTLELEFRDDVVFHNGDRLTAEDFRFTYLDRLQADPTLAIANIYKDLFEDIEVTSPTTAIVHFRKPMPTFLPWLAFVGNFILPKDYFTSVGKDGFLEKPVGSGPYRLVEYQRGSRVVLEAFDDYWNGRPKIDRVVFEIVKDPSARTAAIQSGQADIAVNVPIREAERLGQIDGLTAEIGLTSSIVMIHMMNKGVFTDPNVRVAAHAAIDKQAISRAFYGGAAAPISVPGSLSMPGYPKDFEFAYDPERAKALLAESGYGPGKPAALTFFATNGVYPNDWEVARAVAAMWQAVGIDATLEPVEVSKFFEINAAGQLAEATLWTWANTTNDPELFIGNLMDPSSRFSVWKSDDMGERLAPLLRETDDEKRIAGYSQLARYVIEQGYTIPIVQAVNALVYKDDVAVEWFENGWYEPYRIERR